MLQVIKNTFESSVSGEKFDFVIVQRNGLDGDYSVTLHCVNTIKFDDDDLENGYDAEYAGEEPLTEKEMFTLCLDFIARDITEKLEDEPEEYIKARIRQFDLINTAVLAR